MRTWSKAVAIFGSIMTLLLFPALLFPPFVILIFYTMMNEPNRTTNFGFHIMKESALENRIHELRAKDYHDYQIEDFLARRHDQKTVEIETVDLTEDEETAWKNIQNDLREDKS